ncbi:MAG: hypothetical protein JKY61_11750 [Planctomycetes bacterium]|nr:hypothetical protein [Planctomycetota bacterium]
MAGVDGHELFGVGGSTLTTIADRDGDGVPELLVGFPDRTNSPLPGGKVEVLSGADLSRMFIFRNALVGSNMGSEVVAMGDVDSDGVHDFAFGESGDSTLGTQLGSVQIRSSATGKLLYRIPGFVQGGTIGGTMAGSCDLNGDGISDLLLSDPEGTGNGILHPIMVPNPSGYCGALREEANENGDTCADAVAILDGTYAVRFTSVLNRDMYSFRVAPGATVHTHVSWNSSIVRLSSTLWVRYHRQCGISNNPSTALLAQSTSSGRIDWTNPGPGAMDVVLEVAPGFGFDCRPYDLVLSGSEPTNFGRNYCRVFPNSTGRGATLAATGSLISQENSMVLTAGFVPDGQAMFFLASPGNGLINHVAGSSGVLCVGGGSPIARLHSSLGFTSNGQYSAPIDLTQVPLFSSAGYAIQPGETWFFQGWFRDNGTSNLTLGLEVTFL